MLPITFTVNSMDWVYVSFTKGVLQKAALEVGENKSITVGLFRSDRFELGVCSMNYNLVTEVEENPSDEYLCLRVECGGSSSITISVPGTESKTVGGGVPTELSYMRSVVIVKKGI